MFCCNIKETSIKGIHRTTSPYYMAVMDSIYTYQQLSKSAVYIQASIAETQEFLQQNSDLAPHLSTLYILPRLSAHSSNSAASASNRWQSGVNPKSRAILPRAMLPPLYSLRRIPACVLAHAKFYIYERFTLMLIYREKRSYRSGDFARGNRPWRERDEKDYERRTLLRA